MWEDTLIESRGTKEGQKRWLTVPISLLVHCAVIGSIIVASYWFVEAVQPPAIPVTLFSAPPPPPPPPPAAKPKPKTEPKPVEKVEPTHEVQPTEVTELPPKEDVTEESAPVEGGIEGGVEGGVEGGTAGGVLGGSLGGVVGGGVGDETPMRITAEVKQPVLVKRVEPQYPEIARRARIQGIVILEAVITKEGNVEEVRVLRALHPILDQAAISAVKQWKYKPAMLNDRPVKVYFTVTVNFTLK